VLQATGEWRLGHRPALDGLRGIAAFVVLASHAELTYLRGGGIGVDLFFALSGFLITTLLLEERREHGQIALLKFYARRAVRLFPALALLLLGVAAMGATLADIGAAAMYVGNWSRAFGADLGVLGHTWSLAIEEQFYLVWPLVVVAAAAVSRRIGARVEVVVLVASLAGALASAGARLLIWDGMNIARVYNGTDTRSENLLYGCALAALVTLIDADRLRVAFARAFLPAASLLVALLVFESSSGWVYEYVAFGYTAIALACTVVVAHVVLSPTSLAARALSTSPLVALGAVSYGFYLWQFPVMHVLHVAGFSGVVSLGAGFVLAAALAALSWVLLERPAQRVLGPRFRVDQVASKPSVVAVEPVA